MYKRSRKIDLATMVGVGLLGRWKSICMPQGVYPGVWKCISYLLPTMVARSIFRDQYLVLIHLPLMVTRNCRGYTVYSGYTAYTSYTSYTVYSGYTAYTLYIAMHPPSGLCRAATLSYYSCNP